MQSLRVRCGQDRAVPSSHRTQGKKLGPVPTPRPDPHLPSPASPILSLSLEGRELRFKGLSMRLDWPECLGVGVWAQYLSLGFSTRIKGVSRQVVSKGDWSMPSGWV